MTFMNDFTVGAQFTDTNKTYELLDILESGLSLQEVKDGNYGGCIVVGTMDFMVYFTKID